MSLSALLSVVQRYGKALATSFDEVSNVGSRAAPGLNGIFNKNTAMTLGAVGAVGFGAYIALSNDESAKRTRTQTQSLFDSLTRPVAHRSDYISSSTLGIKDQFDLLGRVYDPKLGDMARYDTFSQMMRSNRLMDAGNSIHEMIQNNLVARGTVSATEVYVEDPRNKVFGYIDAVLPTGVPLEIKSIGGQEFRNLGRPKEQHVSQANFYALAKSSQTAMIMYVSREDPSQRKLFAINADPGRYMRDIAAVRNMQEKVSGLAPKNNTLSGFRPLASWLGGGINYNMPSAHKSKVQGQRARLSNLAIAEHMAQQPHYNHPNGSRAGV